MKISRVSHVDLIERVSDSLSEIHELPRHCDLSQVGPLHMASFYDQPADTGLIRESTQAGMDVDRDLAILKGLIERVERLAYSEGKERGLKSCSAPRTDGVAAFPLAAMGREKSMSKARANAYAEALERYAWATWWDDENIGADVDVGASSPNGIELPQEIFSAIGALVPVSKVICVRPWISNSQFEVLVFFFLLDSGGMVSGGACGPISDRRSTVIRALGELARHAACAHRINKEGFTPETFYEQRLEFMLTQEAGHALSKRLATAPEKAIDLPELIFDEPISHRLDEVVTVHRCLFLNQPAFVGGDLRRLCL